MNKNIRLVVPAELPKVAILDKRVNKTPWNMVQYEECLANKNQQVYVLEIDEVICGFLVVAITFDEVEILQLGIDTKYQGQKLATLLLTEVLAKLDDKILISKVFLEVAANNDSAMALYRKLGFTKISTRRGYYTIDGMKIDAIVMMLKYT
ncbi:MAG: rimI [Burkholderiales bacterium]|jgi:ribosomal-protein-alanine N-acetyltransferase|nr:rimI [Burkholderiales bacterium]